MPHDTFQSFLWLNDCSLKNLVHLCIISSKNASFILIHSGLQKSHFNDSFWAEHKFAWEKATNKGQALYLISYLIHYSRLSCFTKDHSCCWRPFMFKWWSTQLLMGSTELGVSVFDIAKIIEAAGAFVAKNRKKSS